MSKHSAAVLHISESILSINDLLIRPGHRCNDQWSLVLLVQMLLPYMNFSTCLEKNTIIINNPSVDFTTHTHTHTHTHTLLAAECNNNEAMKAENRGAVNPFHFSRPAGQWVSVTNTAASLHADKRSQAMHMFLCLCVCVCVCVWLLIKETVNQLNSDQIPHTHPHLVSLESTYRFHNNFC